MENTLEIDGSLYEGGGQILRVSLCLSIITRRPVRVTNIRAGRSRPGLANSHLASVQLLKQICNAEVEGAQLHSTCVHFQPNTPVPGEYIADCGTAGSISLMFQTVLPILIRLPEPTRVEFTGGTDVSFSPPSHFVTDCLRPTLESLGIRFDYEVLKYGFYPTGGGKVRVTVYPSEISPLNRIESGHLPIYRAEILFHPKTKRNQKGMDDNEYISRLTKAVSNSLRISKGKIDVKEVESRSRCLLLSVWGKTEHNCTLHTSGIEIYEKPSKLSPESLAEAACGKLEAQVDSLACVDDYLQDQVLIFLAMASGPSQFRIHSLTPHSQGVIHLLSCFGLAEARIEEGILTVNPNS